jgi:hypothetical protein
VLCCDIRAWQSKAMRCGRAMRSLGLTTMARWNHRGRRVRAALARLVALVAVASLLVGVLRANARYFFCPLMNVVADYACCGGSESESDANDGNSLSVEHDDCCEQRRVGVLPVAAVASAPQVPQAPDLALVALSIERPAAVLVRLTKAARTTWHTGPTTANFVRRRTMVFLI